MLTDEQPAVPICLEKWKQITTEELASSGLREQEFSKPEDGDRGSQGRSLCWPVAWNTEVPRGLYLPGNPSSGQETLGGPISSLEV